MDQRVGGKAAHDDAEVFDGVPSQHDGKDAAVVAEMAASPTGFGRTARSQSSATACVLWASTGDPRKYRAAGAYRKAMGLNLVERSSGAYQGRLRISKRGSPRTRQWLCFAALRLVQKCGVRPWYEAKKAQNEADARR